MGVLNHKLKRDLLGSWPILLTIVAIIAVGTGSFIGAGSAQRILRTSQLTYYREYRFADFWVELKKAPLSAIERVSELPEIATLQARVTFEVILDLPNIPRPLTGRLISAPERHFDKTINGIHLVRGSGFSDDRDEEVILSEAFAQAHQLNPGDRINLILNRKRESYVIVGTAISPEYVYMVRGEGDFVPDPKHFGILYIKQDYAREVLDFQDACNQIVGLVSPQHHQHIDLILDKIDRMLDPYGVLAVTPSERQASNRFLSDEIRGLVITAIVMPAIFLLVAVLALNILMTRLAERQRTIIGTLKATGYSDRQVMLHFLSFGVVVGLVGGITGNIIGMLFASGMIHIYKGFFQFPRYMSEIHTDLLLMGIFISVLFAVAGTTKGVWTVLKLSPAEAMQPRPPQRGGSIFLEKYPRLWRRLGFRTHIALRSMARNWVRTLSGIISSTLATSIILLTLCMYDSMAFLVDFQFEHVAHSDVDIGMRDEKSNAALLEGRLLPGIDYAEPILGLTCDLRNGIHSRRMAITGLSAEHRLTTPMQADRLPIDIPPHGLVMSRKLADILHVRVGDRLELTPVRGRRQTKKVLLASIVDSFLGLDCYASLDYLNSHVGEADAINSVQFKTNPRQAAHLYKKIKQLPNAQGLSVRADTKANIESTFVQSMLVSLGLMVVFSGVISLGSTMNSTMIEISDRIRDISTFRVLGYKPLQIAGIFFRENLLIYIIGFLLALPFGYAMLVLMAQAYNTELFRIPVLVRSPIVITTAIISFVFVLIAQLVVYRQIHSLDWQEGIKVKE
ncbi:MAG: ABC transporter permease [Planctomycetota bacterium]|jgi:putative ABC transport system permease protein